MKKHLALTVIMLLTPFILSAGTSGNTAYKLPEGITSSDYMSRTIIFRVKPEFRSLCTENAIQSVSFNKMMAQLDNHNS
ncbi:MAG: hypothetical protein IPJ86_05590 [Bacteroidetes bacterium]|nr:hypothetical protein [Bacteroidota bacterium]